MIVRGNSKLGQGIFSWSLPVIKTCPGASTTCLATCYAMRGFYNMPSAGEAHWRNLEDAEEDTFVHRMTKALRDNLVHVFRIHCAGDFYSCSYTRKWIEIVDRTPDVTFYAYTRSWRVKRLQKVLRQLAKRPNFHLWLSTDGSMSRPPKWPGTRSCYLSTGEDDLPRYKVDLVFRDRHKTVMKHTPTGSLVCPFENGIKYEEKITCATCRICWDPVQMQKAFHERQPVAAASASSCTR